MLTAVGLSTGALWQLREPATASRPSATATAASTSSSTASATSRRSRTDGVVTGVGESAGFASRVAGSKCPAALVADASAAAAAAATTSPITAAGASGEFLVIHNNIVVFGMSDFTVRCPFLTKQCRVLYCVHTLNGL